MKTTAFVFSISWLLWVAAVRAGAPPHSLPTTLPVKAGPAAYQLAFGIHYDQPEKYLQQGDQTRLSHPALVNSLRGKTPSLTHLGEIYFWIKREFTAGAAGGKTIGISTTDELLKVRRLGGCHDWALVYASIARELGYPAVMVDVAGITWAKRSLSGQKGPYLGHVFVEVFIGGKWVLVDSTNNGYVADNYDPAHAIIPLKLGGETEGFYVLRKGKDTWGYNIRSNAELTRLMEESARTLKFTSLVFPKYEFLRFK